jgi:small subunit ribosomal protein S4e
MHIKRKTIGKLWPIPRTGSKYLAVPSHEQSDAMPLIIVVRNVLELVKTKKELKKLLNEKKITVNGKIVNETNYPLSLFDVLAMPSVNKYYRVMLKNRYELKEITEKESKSKIYKVIGKKLLGAKKVQLNLNHGRNIISNEKIKVGDFVNMTFESNKIEEIIVLKKGVEVLVIAGKHLGKIGKIESITKEGESTVTVIKNKEGEVKANINNVFATY